MKRRRYVITESDADLIKAALLVIINELEKHKAELSVREANQLASSVTLYEKLRDYKWYVED